MFTSIPNINLLVVGREANLSLQHTFVFLGLEFQLDNDWWLQFASKFNCAAKRVLFNYGGVTFYTDASLNGYGMCCGEDWQACSFSKGFDPLLLSSLNVDHGHWVEFDVSEFPSCDININLLELVPVLMGVRHLKAKWCDQLHNQHIVCYSDNTQVKSCVNKGVSSNHSAMSLLRKLFWELVDIKCFITVRHVPGDNNNCADMLSRIGGHWSTEKLNKFNLCCRNSSGDRF